MKNITQLINDAHSILISLQEMHPLSQYQNRVLEIDSLVNSTNIWQNPQKAADLMKERQKLSDLLEKMNYFNENISFYQECLHDIPQELDSIAAQVERVYQQLSDFEFYQMLNNPLDNYPAILSINAGAGGLEAANWVTMLLRMYCRYAANVNLTVEILDMKPSEEHSSICTDSVSISVQGPFAYGFLKGEAGVHRLIRNSPFSSNDMRHTSFAGVAVLPDIEDIIDIKIDDKDLEITCQTAGGAGGQHQNKVSSAVRLKHLPTNIQFVVRAERDQHANRRTAMKMLKAKLYDIELKKKKAEIDKYIATQSDIAFGHQIRTYTAFPQQIVKDHRSDLEIRDFSKVLDGDIHNFIIANLKVK